jgi:myo-inositol-1(or 4)-monophosphatase
VGAAAPGRVLVSGEDVPARDLLGVAVEAASMAGALLLERARHGREQEVASKSTPTDLVSEADLASERAIRELLGRRRPADGFVGEEGGAAESASGLSWVVDPLDGTVNFLFGIPQWCVSVAVRDPDGTVVGAVYDPNRDEMFTATRDGVPMLSGPDGTVELMGAGGRGPARGPPAQRGRARRDPTSEPADPAASGGTLAPAESGHEALPSAMVATGLAYDANVREAQARVLARLAPRVRDIRRFGSAALDLSWTAAGRYDAYFERSVKQWDVAAGRLICERAGLRVLELAVYENLPWGILVASPALAQPLWELVGGP